MLFWLSLKLNKDLQYLENNVFEINGQKVEFKVGGLPNDMKMLAFLAGELSNSSTYFSSFGNVSKADCNDFKNNFDVSNSSHWRPWEYPKRLFDANKLFPKKLILIKLKMQQQQSVKN